MHLLCKILGLVVLTAGAVLAQPIKSWSSAEDYCRDNPHAPTCRDGKPIDYQGDIEKMQKYLKSQQEEFEKFKNTPPSSARSKSSQATTPQVVTSVAPQAPAQTNYPLVQPAATRLRKDIRLGELDWRLVLPQPDFILGINLSDLLGSEIARTLIQDWAGELGATTPEREKLMASLGDVSQIVISAHQNEMLFTLMGRVDDFPEVNQSGPMQSVKVAPDTVIFGANQTLNSTLFRLKFPLSASARIQEGQKMSQSYQVWMCGKPAAFAALGQGANAPVNNMKFGVSFRDQFRMDMILDAATPAAAKRLLDASGKGAPPNMTASLEGNSVHFAMQLDRVAALERFSGFMSNSMGKKLAPLLAAARQMSAGKASPGLRPTAGKVVIEGLDDGPKEVPVAKP